MGCMSSRVKPVADEKSVFISKHLPRYNPTLAAPLRIVLSDERSRGAFYKWVKVNYSLCNIEFFEEVENLRIANVDKETTDDEFCKLSGPIFQKAYYDGLDVSRDLKNELKRMFKLKTKIGRDKILARFSEAQVEIMQGMDDVLIRFERSKEFNEYIKYSSTPVDPAQPLAKRISERRKSFGDSLRASFTPSTMEVLIIEGTPIVAKILLCNFQAMRFKVFHAVNAKEAKEALLTTHFDLILLSLDTLGTQDSIEVYQSYCEKCAGLELDPGAVVGSLSDPSSDKGPAALDLGMKAVLIKPFTVAEFIRVARQRNSVSSKNIKSMSSRRNSMGGSLASRVGRADEETY